jgi:RNA polymerase sigma-70 factor (ECF subfamily)
LTNGTVRVATLPDGTHPLGDSSATPASPPSPAGPADFDTLYAEHFGFVWRCLRALGVATSALDDAAQEVFLVVHRRMPEFRGDSALRTWLYAIVRNVASNQRRGQRRHEGMPLLDTEHPSVAPGPQEELQDREAAAFVQSFMASVSEKKRDVFVLALLEGMSIPDVAETLSVPLNTTYTRLRDVRLEFQRALAKRRGAS